MNEGIILVDADDASITVAWPPIGKSSSSSSSSSPKKYSLQYRPSTSASDNGIDSGGSLLYTSLSTDLTTTSARKRNLTGAGHGFWFRVSAATNIKTRVDKKSMEYVGHACRRSFKVLTMMEQSRRMDAPVARIDHATASPTPNSYVAHVSWKPYQTGGEEDALFMGYKLQMRDGEGNSRWSTVAACLSGTEVRKKNLTSKYGYMFRVRPVLRGETGGSESHLDQSVCEGGNVIPFSCATDIVGASRPKASSSAANSNLLKLFKKLPHDALLAKGGMNKIKLSSAFEKVDLVFLFATTHEDKKYTPQVVKFYNEARKVYKYDPKRHHRIEIVFVSADQDAAEFGKYYATMPWMAIPYEAETRERLLSFMKVTSSPKLMVLDGRDGKVLESNGINRALDMQRFAKMIK